MQQATHVGSCVEASSDAGSIPAASTMFSISVSLLLATVGVVIFLLFSLGYLYTW